MRWSGVGDDHNALPSLRERTKLQRLSLLLLRRGAEKEETTLEGLT